MALQKEDAAKYALLAMTAHRKKVRFEVDTTVGEAHDEVYLTHLDDGSALVYIDGSDLDNTLEWRNNLQVWCGADFGGAVGRISQIIDEHVGSEKCIIVGYSRGASIAVAVGALSEKETYVVTIGDPALVQSDETNVTALTNQFDFVYGLCGIPVGEPTEGGRRAPLVTSNARWRRSGWKVWLDDVGRHTNYEHTLVDEASQSKIDVDFAKN